MLVLLRRPNSSHRAALRRFLRIGRSRLWLRLDILKHEENNIDKSVFESWTALSLAFFLGEEHGLPLRTKKSYLLRGKHVHRLGQHFMYMGDTHTQSARPSKYSTILRRDDNKHWSVSDSSQCSHSVKLYFGLMIPKGNLDADLLAFSEEPLEQSRLRAARSEMLKLQKIRFSQLAGDRALLRR